MSTHQTLGRWEEAHKLELALEIRDEFCLYAESDTASDLSEVSSIFSLAPSLESGSSLGSINDAYSKASEHLAGIFSEHPELRALYGEALTKYNKERFARNHDSLLKMFFKDLRLETWNDLQLQPIRALRNRPQRGRVTKLISELLDPANPSKLQAIQVLQDGKADRQLVLNRLLQSQMSDREILEQSTAGEVIFAPSSFVEQNVSSDSSETTDGGKEDDSSEEEPENDNFQQLELAVTFIIQTASFARFKASLRRFVHPPTTLEEALECRDSRIVRKLLLKQFNSVAKGEYSWLHELDEVGYTRDEIAELLLEEVTDAPWIYFEPKKYSYSEITPAMHIPGCVHRHCSTDISSSGGSLMLPRTSHATEVGNVRRVVQELCGLAEIAPVSRDLEKWNGTIKFEEQNSTAIVSYVFPEANANLDYAATIARITRALEGFCKAAGQVQSVGLCCDCFTILRHTAKVQVSNSTNSAPIEMWRIKSKHAVELLAELKRLLLLDSITTPNVMSIHSIAAKVLEALLPSIRADVTEDAVNHAIHLCSLAVQFLCLGFLSYSQAHIGALQLFFLDSPQKKIFLQGSQTSSKDEQIVAELADLTCMGNMTQGPVLVFNTVQAQMVSTSSGNTLRYDLLASMEDLLDTWGPGYFVTRTDYKENPCAVRIGGGTIYATDKNSNAFHWSKGTGLDGPFPVTFDPSDKIIIGVPVTVNGNCSIDERKCWLNSATALEPLGTYGPYWDVKERQSGIQAGQYTLAQLNQTWCKIPGKSIKQLQLEQLELGDDLLIPFLECQHHGERYEAKRHTQLRCSVLINLAAELLLQNC